MLSIEKCSGSKCAPKNETDYFFRNTRLSIFISELRVALEIYENNENIEQYMVDGKYYPVTKLTKQLESKMMSDLKTIPGRV